MNQYASRFMYEPKQGSPLVGFARAEREKRAREQMEFREKYGFTVLSEIDMNKLDEFDKRHLAHLVLALQIKSAREKGLVEELSRQSKLIADIYNRPLWHWLKYQARGFYWSVRCFFEETFREARDEVQSEQSDSVPQDAQADGVLPDSAKHDQRRR